MSKKLNAAQIAKGMKQKYGSMNLAYNQLKNNEVLVDVGIGMVVGSTVAKVVNLIRKKIKREMKKK